MDRQDPTPGNAIPNPGHRRALRWAVFLLLGGLLILRWILAGHFGISPDEAYYSLWAERPDLSYYSKGPGVSWFIGSGMALFGKTELGIRFFSPVLALGTALMVYFWQRRVWDETTAAWSVITLSCIPIFMVGGLLLTIDPISVFFWMAALITLWAATREPGARAGSAAALGWWCLTGVFIGLGFLAKYTNAFLLLSILFYLGLVKEQRVHFRRPGFWLMLGIFLILASPPVIWNAQHDWITLTHLRERSQIEDTSTPAISPLDFLNYLGMHLGVYSPLIFAGILGGLGWGIVRARRGDDGAGDDRAKFLVSIALPLVAFYFLLSFKAAGEPNWTVPGIFTAILLAVPWALQKARRSRVFAGFSVAALALGLLMSLAVINTDVVRAVGVPWSYEKDPSTRLRGWRSVADEVQRVREDFARQTGSDPFLIGNDYQMAAVLSFYLPEPQPRPTEQQPPVFQMATGYVQTQFSFWPDYLQPESSRRFYTGRDALFITDEPGKSVPEEISRRFDRTRLISIFEVTRRGEPLRQIRIFALHELLDPQSVKPKPAPEPAKPQT